jgi:hypothetical protein
MRWTRDSLEVGRIPAASVSPEESSGVDPAGGTRKTRFPLIDVHPLKGGLWKASCECGGWPEPFDDERAAWTWIAKHSCPVLDF